MALFKKDKKNVKRMSLWGHLSELRRRLTIIAISVFIGAVIFYFLAPPIVLLLLAPAAPYIIPDYATLELTFSETLELLSNYTFILGMLEAFTLRFFVGFVAAIFVTSPIWLWQILGFFVPALKPNERKWFIPTFAAAVILFLAGAVFCYFFILDPALAFLIGQAEDFAVIFPETANYIDTTLLFLLAFGAAFELPLVIFFLVVFNIVPYKKLRKSWRIVYIVLLVLSAFITPDASPVTMILMFCALAVLYEMSLFIARIVMRKRIKAHEAQEAAEEAADAAADAEYAKRKAAREAAELAAEKNMMRATNTSAGSPGAKAGTKPGTKAATKPGGKADAKAKTDGKAEVKKTAKADEKSSNKASDA